MEAKHTRIPTPPSSSSGAGFGPSRRTKNASSTKFFIILCLFAASSTPFISSFSWFSSSDPVISYTTLPETTPTTTIISVNKTQSSEIRPSTKNRSILMDNQQETTDQESAAQEELTHHPAPDTCIPSKKSILKVYMYDLPPEFHFELLDWKASDGSVWKASGGSVWPDIRAQIPSYPGALNLQHSIEYWMILDLLHSEISDSTDGRSTVRVHNSSDADIIFVPFLSSLSYNRHSALKAHEKKSRNTLLQEKLVRYLMHKEEWKRSGGEDHVIPAHHPNSLMYARTQLYSAMFILCDFGRYPPNIGNVDKDVIAPYKHVIKTFEDDSTSFASRPTLLYFQGAVQRKAGGFIRHELLNMLKNEKDVHFSHGTVQSNGIRKSTTGMRSSKFCLNIEGDTPSSNRLFDAIASHCVPVIISENIELPYEDVLDYSQFCIFVRTEDALRRKFLINYIRSIGEDEWTRMWRRLKEVEKHYEFQYPSKEGDAVQMIWQAVARKLPTIKRNLHKSTRFSHRHK